MPIFTIETPNGKHLDIEADDHDAALEGAQQWYAKNAGNSQPDLSSLSDDDLRALYSAPHITKMSDQELKAAYEAHAVNKPDTSALGALSEGTAQVAQGIGKTIKDYLNPDAGNAVLDSSIAQSNPNYQSALQSFMYPKDGADKHTLGLDWSQLPRAALEQAPGLAVDLGVQALVPKWAGPVGRYIANAATYGLRMAGNEAEKRAEARTGDPNAEPSTEDKLVGLGSTAAQAALGQSGLNKIVSPAKVAATGIKGALQSAGNVVKAGLAEGAAGAGQDLISQGVTKVGTDQEVDPKEALASGLLSGAAGGVFAIPKGAKDAAIAARMTNVPVDEHTTMAANRLLQKVDSPEDLTMPEKAGAAIKAVQSDLQKEVATAAQRIKNPSTDAANAIERLKSGDALTDREMAAIDSESDPMLSSLARQGTSIANVADKGRWTGDRFAGGISEFIRAHTPGLGKYATAGAIDGLIHAATQGGGLDTLASHVPSAAEALVAGTLAYKALQKLDKLTGAYTPAYNFADKFGGGSAVRPDVPLNQSPTGPKVAPQNSLTPTQPWGPVPDPLARFKPDIVEPGIAKIVEKIQRQKQQQTVRNAMPLLSQLAAQNKPAPAMDANALNEQVKGALLMASARRKMAGQAQAEAEAENSPMIQAQGGLDAVRNPAMGKRANELISAANALARLRAQPEEVESPPTAPEAPTPQPEAPSPGSAANAAEPELFVLPESPHVYKEPKEAAEAIYNEAVAGGKTVRHAEGFKAGTQRRLAGEEEIYKNISNSLGTVQERGEFHKYLAALWGSDSPEVVQQVRQHMLAEFPQAAEAINKHLSDAAIKGLWTKPKKK